MTKPESSQLEECTLELYNNQLDISTTRVEIDVQHDQTSNILMLQLPCQHNSRNQLREDSLDIYNRYTIDEDGCDIYAPIPLRCSADTHQNPRCVDDPDLYHQIIAAMQCDSQLITEDSITSEEVRQEKKRELPTNSGSSSDQIDQSRWPPSRKRCRHHKAESLLKVKPEEPKAIMGPNFEMALRYQECLKRSTQSARALEDFDRKNGLPRSHCQTMVNSSRSRKQLQSGLILPKWNGKPLLDIPGAKVVGLHRSRILLNREQQHS